MKKILAICLSIAMLSAFLVGCGGGGGVLGGGALGGAAVNGPLEGAKIYASIGGANVLVGNTGTGGVVTINTSSLAGAKYPLRLWTQNGTLAGNSTNYAGSLSTVLESAAGVSGNLYFSVISSMVAENFKKNSKNFASPAAAVAAAKTSTNKLVAAFGGTFDPLNSNPASDLKLILIQKSILKAAGIDEGNPSGTAKVTSLVTDIINDFGQNKTPAQILQSRMPAITGSPDAYVQALSSTAEMQAMMETQFGDEFSDADMLSFANELNATAAMDSMIGFFEIEGIQDGTNANATIDDFAFKLTADNASRTAAQARYTIEFKVQDAGETICLMSL
ncbi:MAG: hypothetical protein ACNI27_04085 [Desulfovibrio sp.]